jgi:hypothetical protein
MPILGANSSGGSRPSAPVIGSASDGGTGTTASVAFTPSTYIGKGTINYTVTSSPGNFTATSASSPITVSGLTTGTAYTFTVQGTTNYGVVSAVSSASNSVTPASPTSFESIATFTPTSGSSVTFSSIPSTYKSLQIRVVALASSGGAMNVRLNGDTASNYWWHYMNGYLYSPSVTSSGTATNSMRIAGGGQGVISQVPTAAIVDIVDYSSTSKNKRIKSFSGIATNGVGGDDELMLLSGLWLNTSAVNSVTVNINNNAFTSGTCIALYGIK